MHWKTYIARGIEWDALENRQAELVQSVARDPSTGFLLISEPSATFTHGRFAEATDRLWDETRLKAEGARSVLVTRGGKWTFHGPGQIVIYPILQLESLGLRRRDIREFLSRLRGALALSLAELGVKAEERDEPFGLYAKEAKLASFGINVQKGITSHGVALYYSDQSHFFAGIRPCGVTNERLTCLSELLKSPPTWESTVEHLASAIKKGLNR